MAARQKNLDFQKIGVINIAEIIIPYEYNGKKLIDYLKCGLTLSSSEIKRLKYADSPMLLCGRPVTVRAVLCHGDILTLPESADDCSMQPWDTPLDILYEDESILCVVKPSGMAVHPAPNDRLYTLANAVTAYNFGAYVFRAVNRLDRFTSGPVIIAKNADCCYKLGQSMKNGLFLKEYIAVTQGIPSPPSGVIKARIARCDKSAIKRCVTADGKNAETHYTVIGKNACGDALVNLNLITGRTHQIRVHMAHIGCPLKYDFLYGDEVDGKHFMLHCRRLEFPHPYDKKTIALFSEIPFDISDFSPVAPL